MKIVFFLPYIYRHESRDVLIAYLKVAVGSVDTADIPLVDRADQIPKNSTVVCDSLHRFGDTADRAITVIAQIFEHCEIWIPNTLDLRHSNPNRESLLQLTMLITNVKKSTKSARIKESLYIKAQLNGGVIHNTTGITTDIKKLVIEEYRRCGAIRLTSRRLKEIGINVSPSSVSRIVGEVVRG